MEKKNSTSASFWCALIFKLFFLNNCRTLFWDIVFQFLSLLLNCTFKTRLTGNRINFLKPVSSVFLKKTVPIVQLSLCSFLISDPSCFAPASSQPSTQDHPFRSHRRAAVCHLNLHFKFWFSFHFKEQISYPGDTVFPRNSTHSC